MSILLRESIFWLPMHPVQKVVFLALGDWANDEGLCYPSVSRIARRASISPRQAKRVMHELISDDWISVIANHNGGAPSQSRRYQINVRKLQTGVADVTGDGLSPSKAGKNSVATRVAGDTRANLSPVSPVEAGVSSTTSTGDSRVTRTTTEPPLGPPQQHQPLVFPPSLSEKERVVVIGLLNGLTSETAQALIDELAAKLDGQVAKIHSPTQYLRGMAERAKAGTFVPMAGLAVAKRRKAASALAIEATRRSAEAREQQVRLAEARKDPERQARIREQIEETAQLLGRRGKCG